MSYENLDQLVTTVELDAAERRRAKQEVESELAERHKRYEKANEAAEEQGQGLFGPWDKADSLPIILEKHGDKQGLAIVSAMTHIGCESEPQTFHERGWFGIVRERTRYVSKPYVASVSGYSIAIVLGDPSNILDETKYTPVAFEHTSTELTDRNLVSFENLLALVENRTTASTEKVLCEKPQSILSITQ